MIKKIFFGICIIFTGNLISMKLYAKGDIDRGKAIYKVCVACHGDNGGGLKISNAPRIAGQESWYIKRQLYNFKNGIRGSHFNDITGMQMRTMAVSLKDNDIEDLVAYIGTLNGRGKHIGLDGDAKAGEQAYAICASCHGKNGQGNISLNSPKIAGLPDWYVEKQLYNLFMCCL